MSIVKDMRACDGDGQVEMRERLRACDRMLGFYEEGSPAYGGQLVRRAMVKESAGDADGALADYDAGLAIVPDSGFGLLGRGRVLLAAGNIEAAEQTLHRAIEVNDSVIARDMLGGHALLRGDNQLALGYYNAVLDREGEDPMDVTGYYGRGVARLRMGDEGGRADIERAVQMNSRVVETFEERGIRP